VERPDSRPFVRNVRHRVGRYLDLTALWFVQAHSDMRGWLLNFKGASQMGIEGDR
jgi:hypothetical protein